MGEVFLAQDTSLGRKVAIKVLAPSLRQDETARKHLLREAKLAAALDHPFICSIHELLDEGESSCIVMEYVEGQTLRARLALGALPRQDALRFGLEIAEALEKAHLKGIVHRDLKAGNIMLTPDGHVKVMDFGLAKQSEAVGGASEDETRSRLTDAGATVGTLAYMSLEQLEGRHLTPQSDLFSAGVVLYEMVTGVHPFSRSSAMGTAHAIQQDFPAPIPASPDTGTPELQRLLDRILSKSPERRGSVHEARQQLLQQSGPGPVSLAQALRTWTGRALARPVYWFAALLAIAGLFYVGQRTLEHGRKVRWARDVALPEISRLTDAGRCVEAFDLAAEAERYLPHDTGAPVFFPVFKSMFERHDGLLSTVPNETAAYRDHVVIWVKDARRSIDYLQTRPEFDIHKLAYFGHSWGGRLSPIALADDRFRVAVLSVAGFRFARSMPEVDPFNFVSRVRIPVIMLNGRYDHYFPVETAQRPMFTLLGTPGKDKSWIVYDGGHLVPPDQLVKETLAWLDRYLGTVN